MNTRDVRFLQAEQETLATLLAQLPASSVIERQGLEFRKRKVEEALASQDAPDRQPAKLRLMFRGKPIVGSYGIFADFGVGAVKAFTEAVAVIGASRNTSIGSRGRLPNRENYRLLITDTALGSFGFELQEAPQDDAVAEPRRPELFDGLSSVESAVDLTMSILEATVDTDERLTDAIADAHPRALNAVRVFLKQMADHDAICTLEFKDHVFRFTDVGQVRQSEARLSQDHMFEADLNVSGRFRGALPARREFEFLSEENGEVISGKIDTSIKAADAINEILDRPVRIKVHARRVGSAPRALCPSGLRRTRAAGTNPDMHEARDPVTTRDPKDSSFVRSVYKHTEARTTPVGWARATLGDIMEIKNGATPSTRNSSYWDGPIPWCTPTDITDTVGKYLWETRRNITVEGLTSCAATLLPEGAILLCSRATIGQTRIAALPVCTNQGFKSLVCKEGICNEYLYYLIVTLKSQFIKRATGSTFLEDR